MENSPVRLEHGGDHLAETSLSNKPSKQPGVDRAEILYQVM